MKKIFSSIALLSVALLLNANVAYLVPVSDKTANELGSTVVDVLPEEKAGETIESPERNAATWFQTTYGEAANFITLKDVQDGKLLTEGVNNYTTVWVYVDRVGFELSRFEALFTADVRNRLAEYVKNGGNLFVCKQAALLSHMIGRCAWSPTYSCGGYHQAKDTWGVTTNFNNGRNLTAHASFATVEKDEASFVLTSGNTADPGYNRTDNNCVWSDWKLYSGATEDANVPGVNDINRAKSLEDKQNCQILGGWGHTRELQCAGFVEFFPNGDYKGTVMAMGLAAYQWTASNTSDNMKKLTKAVFDYLEAKPVAPVWSEENTKTGVVGSQFHVSATAANGVSYRALQPEVANISVGDGNVYCNYFGEAQFVASTMGDGMNTPKNAVTESEDTLKITINGGSQAVDYAYVLPYSMHVMANWDNEDGQRPDFNAAEWFYNTYVKNGTGCFIRPSDLATINEKVHTLWVNSDHVGLDSVQLMADLGGAEFVSALRTFVNKGNNVFLSKQATRLVGDLRRSAYPSYTNGDYANDRGDWKVGNIFAGVDYSTHSAFARTGANPVIMQKGRHTDNNNLFTKEGADAAALSAFQTSNNCLVLGSWGNNETFECAGMVEFYPQEECNGTIIAMGLAAYHWGSSNLIVKEYGKNEKGETVVKAEKQMMATLTQDILYYLNIKEAPGFVWATAPANGFVGKTLQLAVENKESALRYESSNTSVATVSETGLLTYVAEGDATISAIRYGDGYKLPKNVKEAVISENITVSKEGTSTSVENLTEQPAAEGIYDILGRRISTITTSGIYIVNGKKVVVNK